MAVKTSTAAVIGGVVLLVAAGIYVWPIAWHAPPAPAVPRYAAGRGVAYCRKLGEVARKRSSHDTFVAWIAAILGSFAVIIGNVMEPHQRDTEPQRIRNPAVLALNVGVLLIGGAQYGFSRADAASLTAASAAIAQADAVRTEKTNGAEPGVAQDRAAYVTCAMLRATWLRSRVDSNALGQSQLRNYRSGTLGRRQSE